MKKWSLKYTGPNDPPQNEVDTIFNNDKFEDVFYSLGIATFRAEADDVVDLIENQLP